MRNPPEMYLGSGPELHVHDLEIQGPFYDSWPQPGFATFFPTPPPTPGADYLDESLLRLANAAYRRPVSRVEVAPYLQLAHQQLESEGDFWEAAKLGTRAILTSPNFLYLAETQSEADVPQTASLTMSLPHVCHMFFGVQCRIVNCEPWLIVVS